MKQVVNIAAPAAIGPYSHACVAGGFVYISGQLGFDPETGKLVEGIEPQTHFALKNLSAILAASGASLSQVVKTTVFVTDLANFATVNRIYGEYFTGEYPARSCVQVAALPAGGLVEIEAVAKL